MSTSMDSAGTIASVAIGLSCAIGGVLARPRTPGEQAVTRTIATAALSAVPVLGWILVSGHTLAAALPFVAATAVVGELRDRAERRPGKVAQPSSSQPQSASITPEPVPEPEPVLHEPPALVP